MMAASLELEEQLSRATIFQEIWEENFMLIAEKRNELTFWRSLLLVLYKILNQITKYNIQRHYTLYHTKDFDKYKDECTHVENLKCELRSKNESSRTSVVRVSYKIVTHWRKTRLFQRR